MYKYLEIEKLGLRSETYNSSRSGGCDSCVAPSTISTTGIVIHNCWCVSTCGVVYCGTRCSFVAGFTCSTAVARDGGGFGTARIALDVCWFQAIDSDVLVITGWKLQREDFW